MPLPTPRGEVSLDKAVITPPGAVAPIIKGISLVIEAGTQLAIIGPSAAGKSTLARAILGLYQPANGSVRLDGYNSKIVGNGNVLSAEQRQRLGLARALYGNPQVILLDEPNSNLDQAGDQALLDTLANLKQQGRTVIVITHRSNLLSQVDKILLLVNGGAALYGNRDQVLAALQQSAIKSQPAKVASYKVKN